MSFSLTIRTPEDIVADQSAALRAACVSAIDAHVEAVARSRNYNSAAHLAGYATSTVAQWAAEAAAFVTWRDQVWQAAYAMLGEVEAGTIPAPTPAEAVAALPAISWPD